MFSRKYLVILIFLAFIVSFGVWFTPNARALETASGHSASQEISKEDMEIIKNLELLQNFDVLEDGNIDFLKNYDEVNGVKNDTGEDDEHQTKS